MSDRHLDPATLIKAFHFRHACKQFDPERVIPAEDFAAILEAGRLSPSSFGFEPWRFLVIQDRALREALAEVSWGARTQFPSASHVVAILARKDLRWDSAYLGEHMREVKGLDEAAIGARRERIRAFQQHDFRLFDCPEGLFDWACRQTYIALANMMTAAALLGIDSCPCEGFNRRDAEGVLAARDLLDRRVWGLAVMVSFGYRLAPAPAKTRWPSERVIHWIDA
ncbi:MAG: NAD(P)H-dependent oxidoreductase [Thiobacillaceae bacterium]|nr:NAD(P)H-dependent oxidoreductase [Thiobacillaceae bacterium]MDW8323536.1 NAD(P)H-dependent oxidoreductase [Burkholderiales bacterium]